MTRDVTGRQPRARLRAGVFAALALACVGLARASDGMAEEGVQVRGNASGGDSGLTATVYVGTSAGSTCGGTVHHAGKRATLPSLRTGESGNARWQWQIGEGVPGGHWHVMVTCQLASGPVGDETSFKASGTGGKGGDLVATGTMSKKSIDHTGLSPGGHGGGEEEDGYPPGQCTWWVRLLRPDIPVFPGPAGDARNWAESAPKAQPPFAVGKVAKPGAVVVFQPGQAGAGRFGHVAYVTAVHGPSMTISEANYLETKPGHHRHLRWRGRGFQFIYERRAHPSNPPHTAGSFRFQVYRTCVNGRCGLLEHQGPGTSYPALGARLAEESGVDITCQTRGERVVGFDATSTDVWDRLVDGGYVSDYFVNTPGKNDQFTVPIPGCGEIPAKMAETQSPSPPPPSVTLSAPSTGEILGGTVTVRASSNAKAVRFEALYSDTPGHKGSAAWHLLGTDTTPGDGFNWHWDTTAVPNQGLRREGIIQVAAVAVGETAGGEDTHEVAIANPWGDGSYGYHVFETCAESSCLLKKRSGPGFSKYPPLGTIPEEAEVKIVCQAEGEPVNGSAGENDVWDELNDGSWVSDYYTDTPIAGDFSPPIPRCTSVPPPPTPTIALNAPANGQTLSGVVEIKASSDAPGVRFEAFYLDSPGKGTGQWHRLGEDTTVGDGFNWDWDTTAVPNQGQASEETVRVRAVALDYSAHATGVQDTRRVNVANPGGDGSYAYHVFETCPQGDCFVYLHSGPGYSKYPIVGQRNDGEEVDITCQAHGETVSDGTVSTDVWDELTDGKWVTDFYVDTPASGAFSPPIPEC